MTTEHKTVKAELKQVSEAGEFEAVIATLGVIDSDGDIIQPGAFKGADSVSILPTHNSQSVPLGKGRIEERGDQAVVVGKMNLDTQPGREWHSHLKFDMENPPARQEWSFGFMIEDSASETRDGQEIRLLKSLDVFEASPVLLGAGVNTRTLAVKQRFAEQIDTCLAEIERIAERAGEIAEMRAAKGKTLSADRKAQLAALVEKAEKLRNAVDALQACEKGSENQDDTENRGGPTPEELALADTSRHLRLP